MILDRMHAYKGNSLILRESDTRIVILAGLNPPNIKYETHVSCYLKSNGEKVLIHNVNIINNGYIAYWNSHFSTNNLSIWEGLQYKRNVEGISKRIVKDSINTREI